MRERVGNQGEALMREVFFKCNAVYFYTYQKNSLLMTYLLINTEAKMLVGTSKIIMNQLLV